VRSEHQQSVEWCMRAAMQRVRQKPEIPSEEERILRAKLIFEEAMETIMALGVCVRHDFADADEDGLIEPRFVIDEDPDMEGIADGCADIMVVTLGTLSSCGIDAGPVMEEVLKKNKEKFPGGVPVILPGGKYGKPEGWKPPDIAGVLRKQGWEG